MIQVYSVILLAIGMLYLHPHYEAKRPVLLDLTDQVLTLAAEEGYNLPYPSYYTPPSTSFDIAAPGNCLVAESQCNTCRRTDAGVFACTLVYCANEHFVCTQLADVSQNSSRLPQKKRVEFKGVRETDMAPQVVKDRAKFFLAHTLGVGVRSLQYLRSVGTTWSDTSLGCPESGYAYATVMTPGYTVSFSHTNAQEYTVHTSDDGLLTAMCN